MSIQLKIWWTFLDNRIKKTKKNETPESPRSFIFFSPSQLKKKFWVAKLHGARSPVYIVQGNEPFIGIFVFIVVLQICAKDTQITMVVVTLYLLLISPHTS